MAVTRERITQLLQTSIDRLRSSGMLEHPLEMDDQTVLLGPAAALDSLIFVAFITDVEEQLNAETHRDLILVLNEIGGFNSDEPYLPVATLVDHLLGLTSRPGVCYTN